MEDPPRRRWFSFRLRTLFVLLAALSIPLAWVGYSLNWSKDRRGLLEELTARYGNCTVMAKDSLVTPRPLPRGLALIGEPAVAMIQLPDDVDPALRMHVQSQFPEAIILPASFRPF